MTGGARTPGRVAGAALAGIVLAHAGAAIGAGAPPAPPTAAPFSADEELVLQVSGPNRSTLADALVAYRHGGAVYLPLGEFARALDFAIRIEGPARAQGWFIRDTRRFELDLAAGEARVAGKSVPLPAGAAFAQDGEIYVRSDLIQAWFPLRLVVKADAATLAVEPTEPLPFQERLAREERRLRLGLGAADVPLEPERTPYALFSPPMVDLNVRLATGQSDPSGFDAHAAGDVLGMTGDLYLTGDRRSALSSVRADLGRRDANGVGIADVRQFALGDVFSPELPNGIRSANGRGLVFTNYGPGEAQAGSRTDIRGELQPGWEAELYRNGVLVASQAQPVNGQYAFLAVPLSYGDNALTIVLYGPKGERVESVRHLRTGAGSAPVGGFRYSVGLLQLDKPLFDVGVQDPLAYSEPVERGGFQFAALGEYGLTPGLTLAGHFGVRPQDTTELALGGVGLRGEWRGVALQLDGTVAGDDSSALSGSVLTTLYGVSLGLDHAQYWNGFRDDARSLDNRPLRSVTTLHADAAFQFAKISAPISLELQNKQRADGSSEQTASFRTSVSYAGVLASAGLTYQGGRLVGGTDAQELLAEFGVSGQVLGGLARVATTYAARPTPQFRDINVSWDRYLGRDYQLRVAYDQGLGDNPISQVLGSVTRRFSSFDGTLDLGYDGLRHSPVVGVRLSTSFGWTGARYALARPGLATGGSAAVQVFEDLNADGRREPGEPGVAGVRVQTPGGYAVTGKDGVALTQALGDGLPTGVRIDAASIPDPYMRAERPGFGLTPRPGRRHMAAIGLVRTADVETSVAFGGETTSRSVSNVGLELVDEGGGVIAEARSDFDGQVLFQNVRPGAYRLRLQPDQADALGLELATAPAVTVPTGVDDVKIPALKVMRRSADAPVTASRDRAPPVARPAGAAPNSFTFRGARVKGARAVDAERLRIAWAPYLGKAVSLDDLRTVAAAMEHVYGDAGFPFVAVLVPPQDVRDGQVDFQVVEGRIGEVTVLGLDTVARRQTTEAFSGLIDRAPLALTDVESAYEQARTIPGLAVAGSLRRGLKPGEMDLVVQAKRKTWRFYANVNNLYPEPVGPWGALFGAEYHGASRYGDQTTAQVYASTDAGKQELVRVAHERRLNDSGTTLSVSALKAWASPGGTVAPLDLATDVSEGDITLTQPLVSRPNLSIGISGGFEATDQSTRVFSDIGLSHDRLRTLSLRASARWSPGANLFQATTEVRRGIDFLGASTRDSADVSRIGSNPQAWIIKASLSAETPIPHLPVLRLVSRLEGQWSDDSLSAVEEYTVGNLTIGRGFEPGASYGDSAAGASLELRAGGFPIHYRLVAEPFLFVDGVQVWNHEADGPNRFVASAGAGVRFTLSDAAQLSVTYAQPLDAPLGLGEPTPDSKVLINLTTSLGEVSRSVRDTLGALARGQRGGR